MHRLLFLFVALLGFSGMAFGAARQIIILNVTASQTTLTVDYVLWVVPTNANPVPGFVSAVQGATPAEITTLQAGTTLEIVGVTTFPLAGVTKSAVQTALQNIYTAAQAQATAAPPPVYSVFTGCSYNGSSWTC